MLKSGRAYAAGILTLSGTESALRQTKAAFQKFEAPFLIFETALLFHQFKLTSPPTGHLYNPGQ
jgi:hypothetical protein